MLLCSLYPGIDTARFPEMISWRTPVNLKHDFLRLAATVIWLVVLVAFWVYMTANDYSIRTATVALVDTVKTSPASPLVFAAVLVLRPLTLFPIFLLSVAAGYLYGPLVGTVVVFAGGSISAYLGYLMGANLGEVLLRGGKATALLSRYSARMKQYGFETVLSMRLMYLNWDLISYLAGFIGVPVRGFLVGTLIGGNLVNCSLVLFGAGIKGDLDGDNFGLNANTLLVSLGVASVCVLLSWLIRRRTRVST